MGLCIHLSLSGFLQRGEEARSDGYLYGRAERDLLPSVRKRRCVGGKKTRFLSI